MAGYYSPMEETIGRRLREHAFERVDPDAIWDLGPDWNTVGETAWIETGTVPYRTEADLDALRQRCRKLLIENEFALSGHENRISYLVGNGHRCSILPAAEADTRLREVCTRVREEWERFCDRQDWAARQQEIVLRLDRDGECFVRSFPVAAEQGRLALRFLDPEEVRTPPGQRRPEAAFGILTPPGDPETFLGCFAGNAFLPAAEVQHRKANVDRHARRGVPLFYPVLANLDRAEKLLQAMSTLVRTQASVAVIRKHSQAAAATVQAFADRQAFSVRTNRQGETQRRQKLRPGTIVDIPAGMDYQFPTIGVNAGQLVAVLQAELRAIAARLVMPEFMLSQDASNNNYASALVAEGPAVKHFRRVQAALVREDDRLREHFLQRLVRTGVLADEDRRRIRFAVEPPALEVRDGLAEARKNEILFRNGIKSRETWRMELGLDPEDESRRFAGPPSAATQSSSPENPVNASEK